MGIIVKNITHIYSEGLPHESVALDDVSFTIEDGQFVAQGVQLVPAKVARIDGIAVKNYDVHLFHT